MKEIDASVLAGPPELTDRRLGFWQGSRVPGTTAVGTCSRATTSDVPGDELTGLGHQRKRVSQRTAS